MEDVREEGAYFVDVTEAAGIRFVHRLGDDELSNIVETVGSGAAWLDFDGDGYLDLYVVNGAFVEGISEGQPAAGDFGNRLYRNLEGKGFEEVGERAGVRDAEAYGMGVAVADFDNDGDQDLYVCNDGPNRLFRNEGTGRFIDVAAEAGVAGDANTVGAVWLDFDNDGLLDLYAGNYVEYDPDYDYYYAPDGFPPPMAYSGQPDVLYRNLGDGRFEDVTEAMGVFRPEGRMMGVGSADYDDDGWMDIYVANDAMANYLFHNDQGQGFSEVGLEAGVAFSQGGEETSSMAVCFSDYDGDGRLDLFVSDIHFNALFHNDGNGVFTDVTMPSGIAAPSGQYDAWGAAFVDYDNDADVDIFKVDGQVNHLYGHEDQVFQNRGDGTFEEVGTGLGSYFHREQVGRGAAFADFDNDGDVDVFIVNLHDSATLLRNENLDGHRSLTLRLVGTRSNRDGIGAVVRVTVGGKTQTAQRQGGGGYVSAHDPRLHFGVGEADSAERIEVRWPSGTLQVLERVPTGQEVAVREPESEER